MSAPRGRNFALDEIVVEIAFVEVLDIFTLVEVFFKVTLDKVKVKVEVRSNKVVIGEVALRQLIEITDFEFRSNIYDWGPFFSP